MKSGEDTALATVQVPGGHCLLNEKWRGTALVQQINQVRKVARHVALNRSTRLEKWRGTALAHQINQVRKVARHGACPTDQPG